jgi:hypothetical protein
MDGAATDVEAEAHAREHHPQPCPHRTGAEVRSQQDIEMETDELPPRYGRFALRGWWDAVTFWDVAHHLVAHTITQVGQGPHNAVIPPWTILSGHPHHEVFDRFLNARTANRLRGLGTIALPIRACAVPGKDSVGLGHRRHRCQGLLVQLLANLGECFTITIRELHAASDLLTENAILCHQVRIAQPELFVNRRGDRPEQCLPVHTSNILTKTSYIDDQYGRKRNEIQVEAWIMVEA